MKARALTLASVLVLFLMPLPAVGAIYECGYAVNQFAGWADAEFASQPPFTGVVGASAQIEARVADLCVRMPIGDPDGGVNDATGWSWIGALGDGAYVGYVQSGFMKRDGQPLQMFIEIWKNDVGAPGPDEPCPDFCIYYLESIPNGSRYTHRQSFCSACKDGHAAIQTIIGGVVRNTTPWNPLCCWGPVNSWAPQFFGETLRPGSDIPGDSNLRVWFRNLEVQGYPPASWRVPAGPFLPPDYPHARGAQTTVAGNYFQIYCSASCDPA